MMREMRCAEDGSWAFTPIPIEGKEGTPLRVTDLRQELTTDRGGQAAGRARFVNRLADPSLHEAEDDALGSRGDVRMSRTGATGLAAPAAACFAARPARAR